MSGTAAQHSTAVTSSTPLVNSATLIPPLPTEEGTFPTQSRSTLRRANIPLDLHLLNLMAGDNAVSHHHTRSLSAAGPNSKVNGSVSAPTTKPPTSASAMSALQLGMDDIRSPCFFHKTFGGSINLERVLDECRAEEMTPHNLLQTATGVREVARQLGTLPPRLLLIFRSYRHQDQD